MFFGCLVPEGILGTRGHFGYQRVFWVFLLFWGTGVFLCVVVTEGILGIGGYFEYQRVFWVPLGGDDGYSSVVLHAAALNHKVAGSIPTPAGGGINHKSIINQS